MPLFTEYNHFKQGHTRDGAKMEMVKLAFKMGSMGSILPVDKYTRDGAGYIKIAQK